MVTRNRAAYMREYRAKHRSTPRPTVEAANLGDRAERVAFLESEVVRLKRALAQCQRDVILRKVNRG